MSSLRTVRKQLTDEPVRKSLLRILRENVLCSMATVARGNRAHINTSYFCFSPDLDLYFLSDGDSLHAKNLAMNRTAAVTVFRSSQSWGRSDRGMQLSGACREVSGDEAEIAARLYGKRFPRYAEWLRGATRAERRHAARLRTYRFYRFRPSRIKILDEATFGGGVFVVVEVKKRRASA